MSGQLLIDAYRTLHSAMAEPSRGSEDPADPATVQAMQIALHIPKQDPPKRGDLLAAAAQAVVAVCLDPRAGCEGEWRDALAGWYGHRIRKIARRARGASWEHVQALRGCSATHGTAQARAFIPSAVGDVPHDIAKLQIKGTDLPHEGGEVPTAEEIIASSVPTVIIADSLGMSVGKAAAQAGHAAMLLAAAMGEDWVLAWVEAGFPLVVHELPDDVFNQVIADEATVVVQDAGFTEVAPGSVTAAAYPGSFGG